MQGKIYYSILVEFLVYIADAFHVSLIADSQIWFIKWVPDAVNSFLVV